MLENLILRFENQRFFNIFLFHSKTIASKNLDAIGVFIHQLDWSKKKKTRKTVHLKRYTHCCVHSLESLVWLCTFFSNVSNFFFLVSSYFIACYLLTVRLRHAVWGCSRFDFSFKNCESDWWGRFKFKLIKQVTTILL